MLVGRPFFLSVTGTRFLLREVRMNGIAWIVLAALLIDFGLNWVADHLNLKAQPDRPPEAFKAFFKNEEYQRSRHYLRVNIHFGRLDEAVQLTAVLIFWFGGGFPALDFWG